ncbi:MAG: patatin-like phospholipase family protein [Bacillus sp. (in: firmicutes)]
MFIDAVFSGGGVKGYALIGGLQVLQEKGMAVARAAGTSAGSLVAALVMAGYTADEIEQLMLGVGKDDFVDKRHGINLPLLYWFNLYWRLGLYKGDQLEKTIEHLLEKKGIRVFGDLPAPDSLRLIASDISSGCILVLPDDLPKYGVNPMTFRVATAVRMSCSIPYFFRPVKLKGKKIVDGGVLSNFPMWLFDQENVKKVRPVIGMKLLGNDALLPKRNIDNAISMFAALFETMKDAHDNRYISRKHEKNIIFIPPAGVGNIDFDLATEQKLELLQNGRAAAETFLKKWPNKNYMETRIGTPAFTCNF